MNQRSKSSKFVKFEQAGVLAVLTTTGLTATSLLFSTPALAHHAMGSELPTTFLEGFVSGLAHPIIGLDHFAFVVSVGLLAAMSRQGIKIPISFVLAAMLGTGLHLAQIALPAAEFVISGSVLLFGILLALKERPNHWILTGLAAFIGLFHGYAYGESIFGAEMSPLIAYLIGFTAVQLGVAIAAFLIGRTVVKRTMEQPNLPLRFAGFVLCGAGAVFLSTLILETIFPA